MDDNQSSTGPTPVCLARGDSSQLAPFALVLEAMDIEYSIDKRCGELVVAEDVAARAAQELHLYQAENADWPVVRPPLSSSYGPVAPTLLMMAALVLLFGITGPWALQGEWFGRGIIDTQAVVTGRQWWRLITGLTLHADAVHLIGNCLLGGLLIHLLSSSVGFGVAWVVLLFSGALGNAANVLVRQQPHHSVGFSTAIFAVIGALVAMQTVRLRQQAWRHMVLPLGAGAALLALLGSEGERADLGAHLFGFLAGLVIGWPLGLPWVLISRQASLLQSLLFTLSGLVPIVAWWLAWR